MIIEAKHSHICWALEHDDQSALCKNLLNSAQIIDAFNISLPNGITVSTFNNTNIKFLALWAKSKHA